MMLRSSSTPILGSLLPSFSDSPNNNNHNHLPSDPTHKLTPNSIHGKISCGPHTTGKQPIFLLSALPADTMKAGGGFRRVQSEGNLDTLGDATYNVDELSLPKKPARKPSCRTLECIPSFSFHQSRAPPEHEEGSDEGNGEEFELGDFCNQSRINGLVSKHMNEYGGLSFGDMGKMYLAAGLGVSGFSYVDYGGNGGGSGSGGGGGGGSYRVVDFDRDRGDVGMEEHYKRMMEENPGNALFLRNYAQFLHQKKRDLEGAEEYYSRAILADPKDGEILSHYAKLIWELHGDRERAANYFERAVQASSEDSHVQAAYASFLWDTEEEDEEDEHDAEDNFPVERKLFRHGFMTSATV